MDTTSRDFGKACEQAFRKYGWSGETWRGTIALAVETTPRLSRRFHKRFEHMRLENPQ